MRKALKNSFTILRKSYCVLISIMHVAYTLSHFHYSCMCKNSNFHSTKYLVKFSYIHGTMRSLMGSFSKKVKSLIQLKIPACMWEIATSTCCVVEWVFSIVHPHFMCNFLYTKYYFFVLKSVCHAYVKIVVILKFHN